MRGNVLPAVFSRWSNSSFKTPLIFAAFACILSNLLYCTSYDHGGLALLMVSRFMTGLGGIAPSPLPRHSISIVRHLVTPHLGS